MDTLKQFILLLIFTFTFSAAYGQIDTDRLDDYLFKIVVISPGKEIYMWWGHIALIVEDTRLNSSRLYNWGMFTYPGDSFIRDFIDGKVQYMCIALNIDVEEFISEGWGITAYTLNLDRKAKESILSYAEESILPLNRYYDYKEYSDNCSTRIRDLIDLGTGGQFMAAHETSDRQYTIRQYIRRYTWSKPISDWLLNLLMGQNLDKKVTSWEGMFLPAEIARNIIGFSYSDEYGMERRLVSSVETYNSARNGTSIRDHAPPAWPFSLAIGLLFAVLLFFVNVHRKNHQKAGRLIWGISQSILGLILGLAGCILFIGLFLMEDEMIQQNLNILFINPLLLIIVPPGILTAVKKRPVKKADKFLRAIWTYVFIAGSITMLLNVMPFYYQQNQSVLALILPVAFVFCGIPLKIKQHYKISNA